MPTTRFVFFLFLSLFSVPSFANPEASTKPSVQTYEELLHAIRETRAASEARIEAAVEEEKVREAWETGKLINQHILLNEKRAQYGKRVLQRLSLDLVMSETELGYILQFARTYPISPPAEKLSWAHYRELLSINNPKERQEVTKQAVREGWNREQVRDEVRRLQGRNQESLMLPEITPGTPYTYSIIRLKDRLKIDLGFGIYLDLPEKDAKKFKEGDIVRVDPSSEALVSVIARPPLFTYNATVTQVVDGDTFHALINLGFGITVAQRVRLRRIDAPEILTADGKEAKAVLEKILSRDQGRILMKSVDIDQHGRPIADVWVQGKPVDQELLDLGLGVSLSE